MRTLISTAMAALAFFIFDAQLARAANRLKPDLEVIVKGHHGTQWTKVFKSGSVWVCKTELNPYMETPVAPFLRQSMGELRSMASVVSHEPCHDPITVIDRTNKIEYIARGCESSPEYSRFMKRLYHHCGR